jgi:hypothetical protein
MSSAGLVRAEFLTARNPAFFSYFLFVALSLVRLQIFAINILVAVILIFLLDAFSFWIHARSSELVPKAAL